MPVKKLLPALLFLAPLSAEEEAPTPFADEAQEYVVNLHDPVFTNGVISTDQGGVVTSHNLRIQAQKIEYTNKIENGHLVKKVVAEGDLMMEYGQSVFVGKKLEYDFVSKTGTLWDGKTFVDMWFVGGERVHLKEDGSYNIFNAYITTCESQENTWDVHAGAIKITKDHLLSAKNVSFRFVKIPFFWLPSFKSNLKFFSDPPIKYKLTWDKGLGPRATMRYRIFSWERLSLYLRFDYRLKRGPGGALESDFSSKSKQTFFQTKNYSAYDKTVPTERGNKRYRLQGLFRTRTDDDKTHLHLTYDKLSDDKMPSDFKSDDFEIDTQKRTRLFVTHARENLFSTLSVQPRINFFQSINQELPLATVAFRPVEIGRSGILSENAMSAGYLDYVFTRHVQDFIPHRSAARVETRNQLYRPISLGEFTLTPSAGILGIFYSNNPHHQAVWQGVATYGAEAKTHLMRDFNHFHHRIEPYLTYQGLSEPLAGTNKPFIFSIDDGLARLNMFRMGVRNAFFTRSRAAFAPSFVADLYTNAFIHPHTFHRVFPKVYSNLGWNRSSFSIQGGLCYNIEERLWDYTNARTDWTVNENLAFGLEFRHRSRFDWRKADHENFIVDVARTLSQMLHSPMSDGRNTFLTRLFLRFSPEWSCQLQTHHGWGRKDEPSYNEANIDFFTMLTSVWRLKVSYRYSPNDPFHMTAGLSLVK
jgi:hypothetical protein